MEPDLAVQPCECGKVIGDDEHHCWIHHEDEWVDEPFIVCPECFHVYATAEDLETAWQREFPEGTEPRPAAEIFFCQECVHDF